MKSMLRCDQFAHLFYSLFRWNMRFRFGLFSILVIFFISCCTLSNAFKTSNTKSISVDVGKSLRLKCASDSPTTKVKWMKGTESIRDASVCGDNDYTDVNTAAITCNTYSGQGEDDNEWVLYLTVYNEDDFSRYTCQHTDKNGRVLKKLSVQVDRQKNSKLNFPVGKIA